MGNISKKDYINLFEFRIMLRKFLSFSEKVAEQEHISPQQHQLLLALKGHPDQEALSITEIAQALLIKHHSAVELVNRFEKSGYVVRERSNLDRRVIHVRIAPKGEQMLEKLSIRHLEELHALKAAFGKINHK